MTKGLHVPSEIGKLRKVCLHRPGDELLNLPPDELERLLFDDVPFLEVAQQEHDTFAQILRDQGVEVLYLENLVAEVFDQVPGARAEFTDQYIAEAGIRGQHMPQTGHAVQKRRRGQQRPQTSTQPPPQPDGLSPQGRTGRRSRQTKIYVPCHTM